MIMRGPEKPNLRLLRRWFRHLAHLPVVALIHTAFTGNEYPERMHRVIEHFCDVLPSMHHLRRVELTVGSPALMKTLVHCISKSSITDVNLRGPSTWHQHGEDQALNRATLREFMSWLKSKNATTFALETYRFECKDAEIESFYTAIEAADALERLIWTNCEMPQALSQLVPDGIWNVLPQLLNLTLVDFSETCLNVADEEALATALVGSNAMSRTRVRVLSLKNNIVLDEVAMALAAAFRLDAILVSVERRLYVTKEVILTNNNGVDDMRHIVDTRIPPNVKIILSWSHY
ncbi:hypothetical protein H310_02735 [Aphanomyces invadans]|uniref:Uncharacterized protein n=1 Tax=Aphanomyces invadans TaxID=157072 RepID=A0A024UKW9_9STRA|nr:hypothetical protein H310_02735 [Aphanomyces invadans]ETW06492.1 hypothetical protein H310_02735 [Aphanomyces invadans]|eukprot:XP_008864567.1 hypothetical protein H310_02735 [Aphanomyces invadans]